MYVHTNQAKFDIDVAVKTRQIGNFNLTLAYLTYDSNYYSSIFNCLLWPFHSSHCRIGTVVVDTWYTYLALRSSDDDSEDCKRKYL